MKTETRSKYSVLQNIQWVVKLSWKHGRRVLVCCIATASLEAAFQLVQLYIAPEVLARVERSVPLRELLAAIGAFSAALFLVQGVKQYVSENTLFPRIDVRSAIIGMIAQKSNATAYPNTLDEDFVKLREKAHTACEGNSQATEHVWETLTGLLTNIGGLAIYLGILSRINGLLLLVVIATCAAGFYVSQYAANWRYARRDEGRHTFRRRPLSVQSRNPQSWQRTSAFSVCRTGSASSMTGFRICILRSVSAASGWRCWRILRKWR